MDAWTYPIHYGPPPPRARSQQWSGGSWIVRHPGRSSHTTLVKENDG